MTRCVAVLLIIAMRVLLSAAVDSMLLTSFLIPGLAGLGNSSSLHLITKGHVRLLLTSIP